jgi:uncharacterized membrane protein
MVVDLGALVAEFLIWSLVPIINFIVLLFVVIGLQQIRHELHKRLKRFERIEHEVETLKLMLEQRRG